MTDGEVERAIQFLIEHHAKVSAQSERNSEQIRLHSEQIKLQSEQIRLHSEQIGLQSEQIAQLVQVVSMQGSQAEADRAEIREAINNLIVANEVTRDLAEKTARLTIVTSQRLDKIESQS
jgi:hypothetical protein